MHATTLHLRLACGLPCGQKYRWAGVDCGATAVLGITHHQFAITRGIVRNVFAPRHTSAAQSESGLLQKVHISLKRAKNRDERQKSHAFKHFCVLQDSRSDWYVQFFDTRGEKIEKVLCLLKKQRADCVRALKGCTGNHSTGLLF